jgi:TPR repeat protein
VNFLCDYDSVYYLFLFKIMSQWFDTSNRNRPHPHVASAQLSKRSRNVVDTIPNSPQDAKNRAKQARIEDTRGSYDPGSRNQDYTQANRPRNKQMDCTDDSRGNLLYYKTSSDSEHKEDSDTTARYYEHLFSEIYRGNKDSWETLLSLANTLNDVPGTAEDAKEGQGTLNSQSARPLAQAIVAICYALEDMYIVPTNLATARKYGLKCVSYLQVQTLDEDNGNYTAAHDHPHESRILNYCMGMFYCHSIAVEKDFAEGMEYIKLVANAGFAPAQYKRGNHCTEVPDALMWFQRASDQQFVPASYALGVYYQQGKGMPPDIHQAIKYFSQSAGLQQYTANECGMRVVIDTKELEGNFHSIYGYANAQYALGQLCEEGLYAESGDDLASAALLFQLAADQGHTKAQCTVAEYYRTGHYFPKDPDKAFHLFRLAADAGNTTAQTILGEMFEHGQADEGGIIQRSNMTEAIQLYKRAATDAKNPNAGAQYNLARCYDQGITGVLSKNDREAVIYYKLSAKQNHPAALFQLGLRYETGSGVHLDHALAYEHFVRSAEQGYDKALYMLNTYFCSVDAENTDLNIMNTTGEENEEEEITLSL